MNAIQSPESVAQFLASKIRAAGIDVAVAAEQIGYTSSTAIKHMQEGRMKVPVNKVVALANAIGVEPGRLLRMVLDEYLPGTIEAIEACLSVDYLTERERDLVESYRRGDLGESPELLHFDGRRVVALLIE